MRLNPRGVVPGLQIVDRALAQDFFGADGGTVEG
jgi:hypothetical protein